ncbi:DUF4396 domain-containing protein [Streptomyces sp. NPDC021012]|uniref:DUF4396 domain-containing protein n=1 Tax=unclassified Streptomyces TaxID=2593676 RepID=UPI0037A101CE
MTTTQHVHHPAHHADHDHGGHHHPAAHGPRQGNDSARVGWRTAARATAHCLTGCAIGEVLGMVLSTALRWGNTGSVALSVALAFLFGYSLTVRSVLGSGIGLRRAIGVALAADTLSIAVMEIADNLTMVVFPGAMNATLGEAIFWTALALSLAVAFTATLPVNKWMIGRGGGHAALHAHHH